MADTPQENFDLNNAFYLHLYYFYKYNKAAVRKNYKKLTKAFLDYNDPERPGSFLRIPQYEALEMYVFLKEFLITSLFISYLMNGISLLVSLVKRPFLIVISRVICSGSYPRNNIGVSSRK